MIDSSVTNIEEVRRSLEEARLSLEKMEHERTELGERGEALEAELAATKDRLIELCGTRWSQGGSIAATKEKIAELEAKEVWLQKAASNPLPIWLKPPMYSGDREKLWIITRVTAKRIYVGCAADQEEYFSKVDGGSSWMGTLDVEATLKAWDERQGCRVEL